MSLFRTKRWILPAVLALTLAVCAGPAAALAAAGRDVPQATVQEVLARLDVGSLPADYAVLLDTSGSMQERGGPDLYRDARAGLAPLLDALDPKDRLTLINFDSAPRINFTGSGAGADALDRLPARATGDNTDLGAAIKAAVDALDETGVTDPATVLLLTDGEHDPAPGSRYGPDTASWVPGLRADADRIAERRSVRGYALPLAERTDARLLTEVFGDATVVNLPRAQLREYLDDIKDRVRVDKAAGYLRGDRLAVEVRLPRQVTVPAEGADIVAELTSAAGRVPLHVSGLTLTVDGVPGRLVADPVDLAPKATAKVRFRAAAPQAWSWGFGTSERVVPGRARLTGTVESPWSQVMTRDLRLPFKPPKAEAETRSRVVTTAGVPLWWFGAALLLLLLLAALLRYLAMRRWVTMNDELEVAPADGPPDELRLIGRRVRLPRGGRPEGLTGQVDVRAQRQARLGRSGTERVLYLSYLRAGRTEHARLRPGQSATLHGDTRFTHVDRSGP
ncbi:vWA domain-containing protein [Spongiactinospora sp. TRM90649]|uniref:vWA domain-containing protein n=1 Tax=Spongiactinospora sp. TRM90649 TaxID=3031114 RepID=UPI0023F67DE1|nr:vWA domain-containing protein [Spongiactinospora sp. TRM90649]MDF5752648.1 VWA domain-containing protein [Spongiactinospora sp. TRM90649]